MPKYKVSYSVTICMVAEVEAESKSAVKNLRLPGAYDGISVNVVPDEVVCVEGPIVDSIQEI